MTNNSPASDPFPSESSTYWSRLRDFAWVIALLWVIEISDSLIFGNSLQTHGIQPRSFSG